MGLDQYAVAIDENGERQDMTYWRKHNRLQGWMENLWRSKGNEGEFNCVDVELTEVDLTNLSEAVEGNGLPETGGFFFGADSYEWYDQEYEDSNGMRTTYRAKDIQFINDAREALKDGMKVVYGCWW